MVHKKTQRNILVTAAMCLGMVMTVSTVTALASTWVKDKNGYRYFYDDETYAQDTWIQDEGRWYYLAENGYMLTNSLAPNGRYLDSNGVLVKNSGIDHRMMEEKSANGTAIAYNKHTHRLELWCYGQFLYTCMGDSGRNPGDKEIEGDAKTPLGEFYVCSRVEKKAYYKGLGLSYPNIEDAERGLEQKLISQKQYNAIKSAIENKQKPNWSTKLGGAIMIHGGRKESDGTEEAADASVTDGSSGCISVSNEDMDFLWYYAQEGATVIIIDTGE